MLKYYHYYYIKQLIFQNSKSKKMKKNEFFILPLGNQYLVLASYFVISVINEQYPSWINYHNWFMILIDFDFDCLWLRILYVPLRRNVNLYY